MTAASTYHIHQDLARHENEKGWTELVAVAVAAGLGGEYLRGVDAGSLKNPR